MSTHPLLIDAPIDVPVDDLTHWVQPVPPDADFDARWAAWVA